MQILYRLAGRVLMIVGLAGSTPFFFKACAWSVVSTPRAIAPLVIGAVWLTMFWRAGKSLLEKGHSDPA